MSPGQWRKMVDRQHPKLPIVRQCALLGVSRSSLYYRAKEASEEDLSLMGGMDRQYLETPFYGSRRMKAWLDRQGIPVSRKRVQRLMRVIGLRAIYRRPRTSRPAPEHRVYPYLLEKIRADKVRSTPDNNVRRSELLTRLFTPDGRAREGLENQTSLSSADVAALFQMTERSIRKLAADGRLPHMRTLGGGRLLYPAHQIAVLYRQFYSYSGLKELP